MKSSFINHWLVRLLLTIMLLLTCVLAYLICQEIRDVSVMADHSSSSNAQGLPEKTHLTTKTSVSQNVYAEINGIQGYASQASPKVGSEASLEVSASDPVVEASEDAPDIAPPFLYEIKPSKMALLDQDQQLAVQKAFESYLAFQQAGGGNTDLRVLKESSEKLKEQLAAEIGPIAVHDLMQGE
ncbi:MAG: hypothetical protein ORN23_02645 [Chthoniobacterales bacterium]|nr:hypothetical protein [Chthoniobacterales bacterium]